MFARAKLGLSGTHSGAESVRKTQSHAKLEIDPLSEPVANEQEAYLVADRILDEIRQQQTAAGNSPSSLGRLTRQQTSPELERQFSTSDLSQSLIGSSGPSRSGSFHTLNSSQSGPPHLRPLSLNEEASSILNDPHFLSRSTGSVDQIGSSAGGRRTTGSSTAQSSAATTLDSGGAFNTKLGRRPASSSYLFSSRESLPNPP